MRSPHSVRPVENVGFIDAVRMRDEISKRRFAQLVHEKEDLEF